MSFKRTGGILTVHAVVGNKSPSDHVFPRQISYYFLPGNVKFIYSCFYLFIYSYLLLFIHCVNHRSEEITKIFTCRVIQRSNTITRRNYPGCHNR